MFKPLLTLLAGVMIHGAVFAQVALNPDHPTTYVVKRGDTLWSIASKFLRDPWLWPEIWDINQDINNPHLIYPGDVLDLSFIDGQARVVRRPGERQTIQLGPEIRRTSLRDAIDPIDLQDILPFLDKRTVLGEEDIVALPYVVEVEEGYLRGTEGQLVYVRGLNATQGQTFAIVRPTVKFLEVPERHMFGGDEVNYYPASEPWGYPAEKSLSGYVDSFWQDNVMGRRKHKTRVLGYEVRETAVGEVVTAGDPTTLRLMASTIEVSKGDLVIPIFATDFDPEYYPHALENVESDGYVIGLSKALFGAGRHQVVAINKGRSSGVENGHVLSLHRPSREIRDEVRYPMGDVKTFFSRERRRDANVTIPPEYSGHAMVFKTYDNLSYALIVRSQQAVKVGDILAQP